MAWKRMGLNFYMKNLSDIYNRTKIIETHCLEFISDVEYFHTDKDNYNTPP